jgi:DNA-binding beta-propeller fold protein YncE
VDDERLFVLDDEGWIWTLTLDGDVVAKHHLVKTTRGFPVGITIEPDGNLLIADTHESRVLRITRDAKKLLSIGHGYGSAPGEFVYPQRIALAEGKLFVTEYGFGPNNRFQVFEPDGTFVGAYGDYGRTGAGFARPAGIVVGPDGNLYIADGSHRIVVWTTSGEFVREFGHEGPAPGEFTYPWGLAGDAEYLYVAEFGASRISRFRYDGHFAGVWGGPGTEPGLFHNPRDLAIARGFLFIADTGNDRIVKVPLADIPWRTGT